MEAKYGFTIHIEDEPENILHMVGFEKKPTEHDWNHIMEELSTEPEWDYLQAYRWEMRYSTKGEVDFIQKQMSLHESNENSEFQIDIHGSSRH